MRKENISFKENNYDYGVLFNNQDKFPEEIALVSDNHLATQDIFDQTNIELPFEEKQDAVGYIKEHRNVIKNWNKVL